MSSLSMKLLADAIRAVCEVFRAGPLNSAQVRALEVVRVILGDIDRIPCDHGEDPDGLLRKAVYDEYDRLVCEDCREVVG